MDNYSIRKTKVFYSFKNGIEKIYQVIALYEDEYGIYHINMIDVELGFCIEPFMDMPYCERENLLSMLNCLDIGEVRDYFGDMDSLDTIPLTYVRLS